MLTPQELLEIVDTMYPLLDEINDWIVKDIIRRMIACLERGKPLSLSESDKWQLELYKAAAGHYDDLIKKLKEWTKKSDAEIQAIFEDAGLKAWSADDAFYVDQGLESIQLLRSEALMSILIDTYQRTQGEVHNFTRTTARNSEQRFINACDKAHLKVVTGAQSYTGAVLEAVNELASAQTIVKYPSGHIDTIETAVLRCVRTGTAQASGNLSIQGMVEHGWDVILVSAHLGARYGDGGKNPGNHFWWQGKFYSREGKTPGLPDFVESTGYGTGEGLCGWNCRHSFGPGTVGHNPYKDFDAEENKKAYDLSQKQRGMESAIRHTKTKLIGQQTAIDNCPDPEAKAALQVEYDKTALKLKQQNEAYNRFCKDNNLRRYDDRLQIARLNRSEARKAAITTRSGSVSSTKKSTKSTTSLDISAPKVNDNEHSLVKYDDVTDNWYPEAVPGSHQVTNLAEYEQDGVTYFVDGHSVVMDYKPNEKRIAELLESKVGGEIYMVPRVNYPEGISTPDYIFNGHKYDLKTITGKSKNVLYNAISRKGRQSTNFIFDLSGSPLSTEDLIKQAAKLFTSEHLKWLEEIVLIREDNIVKVLRRK